MVMWITAGYIVSFCLFVSGAFWEWNAVLKKKRIWYLPVILMILSGSLFVFFVYQDTFQMEKNAELAAEEVNRKSQENPDSAWVRQQCVREEERLHSYSWDQTNLDLETSVNKAVAAEVLHNISLNYLLESIVMLDEDALSLKEFRKDKARWLGTYMDLEGICYQRTDASELSFTKLFTSINPDCKVVAFYYDYPDQEEKFIVWRPDTKWAPEKLEEAGYPDGIYIGQINRDGENFDVFVSNE